MADPVSTAWAVFAMFLLVREALSMATTARDDGAQEGGFKIIVLHIPILCFLGGMVLWLLTAR